MARAERGLQGLVSVWRGQEDEAVSSGYWDRRDRKSVV